MSPRALSREILPALILVFLSMDLVYHLSDRIPADLATDKQAMNVWFGADIPRYFENMTERWSDHYRTKVHPLFSLATFPPVRLIAALFDLSLLAAVHVFITLVAGLWTLLVYVLTRMVSGHIGDAILLTTLALSGSATLFWLTVPETYALGSITLLVPVILLAAVTFQRLRAGEAVLTLASAAALSITVTNWMSGILAAATLRPWRQAAQIAVNGFFIVSLLWGVEKLLFPSAHFFLDLGEEKDFLLPHDSGGPLSILRVLFSHSLIAPALNHVETVDPRFWDGLSIQSASLGSSGTVGLLATIIWTLLLIGAPWAIWHQRRHLSPFAGFLALLIGGQVALHLLYGDETFLYTLHILPLLITAVALVSRTPWRPWALALVAVLIPLLAYNNASQFNQATAFVLQQTPQRSQLLYEMDRRPQGPWPRGKEHVVLAVPGAALPYKAYLEAGGSFSPSVGSFGVSLWLLDPEGRRVTSSDEMPLDAINQRLGNDPWQPQAEIQTGPYRASWSWDGTAWNLRWQVTHPDMRPVLMIRSPGPAGGPIQRLAWDQDRLLVNDRWQVQFLGQTVKVRLGDEREGFAGAPLARLEATDGWLFAQVESGADVLRARILDLNQPRPPMTLPPENPSLRLDLPEPLFADALRAQAAHLLMGLEGDQTRPGEPVNYPLEWLRDGAYVVVALVRAGYLETAQKLIRRLAERDFFGGFGAEADAPGLALWAMGEVSRLAGDGQLDAWLWPHAKRKLELIREMLRADYPVYHGFSGPLVPDLPEHGKRGWVDPHWVADPVRNGLIQGKMDNHQPVMFVNAVTYAGLRAASALARRVGDETVAHRAEIEALSLQRAWQAAIGKVDVDNPRTTIAGLWPSGVALGAESAFRKQVQRLWAKAHPGDEGLFAERPLWTYFDIAQMHQWLFLGEPAKVWLGLRWFWAHQASPGLFTWWEGDGEENTFHRWENYRGWVKPPFVTPHYWTAAEMLLLQLDMLAQIHPDGREVVIGAGIPRAWLDHDMTVEGMVIPGGRLDWQWTRDRLLVRVCGRSPPQIITAPVFPEGVLEVTPTGPCP